MLVCEMLQLFFNCLTFHETPKCYVISSVKLIPPPWNLAHVSLSRSCANCLRCTSLLEKIMVCINSVYDNRGHVFDVRVAEG